MLRVPNLFYFWTATSVLIALINCDSPIITGLMQRCKIVF